MPGSAPSVKTESEALVVYLRQQRNGLKYAAYGLTEEQARLRPTASALSVSGLIKHGTTTERMWVATMLGRPETADQKAYLDTFNPTPAETVDSLVAELEKAGEETEVAIAGLVDLDQRVQLPSAPWHPRDPEGFSARWILFHILEELARHAGHADIIREHIDGATMYELMAGAEGWPATQWLKPWRPASNTEAATPFSEPVEGPFPEPR